MALQSGRLIGRISSFVAAGVLFAAGLIVGLIPYSEGGYSGLCPSALQGLFGGMNSGQSLVNFFSGGRCTSYVNTMTIIMVILMILAVIGLVAAILLRKRRIAAAAAGRQAPSVYTAAPAQPGYAPSAQASTEPDAGYYPGAPSPSTSHPAADPNASGTFDTRLLLVGVAAVAGIVLISFAVDLLSFLPGILELLIWAAVAVTAIWQLKRRAAGADERRLAEAEAWNPAVIVRSAVAAGRCRFELHRAERREAERAQASTWAQRDPAQPDSTGDEHLVRPDVH